jgi:hypothetical protein
MSFIIALMLTIFVCMYATKNFPGAITDILFGTLKIFLMLIIILIILMIVSYW